MTERRRDYYRKNRKKILKEAKQYYKKNRKRILKKVREYNRKFRRNNPELASVRSHFYGIVRGYEDMYSSMPFYDDWNPDKGGSLRAGGDWIIKHLGKRPGGSQLHIISHEKGFIPGNLEWTYPQKQLNQQMFRVIAQLRHRIKQLEAKLERRNGASIH